MAKAKERNNKPRKPLVLIFFLFLLIPIIWFLFLNKDSDLDKASDKLPGNWLRSDGTYTISISNITEGGQMKAAYFNPKPINVELADWGVKEGKIFIHVSLDDVNYRGSNYKLIYVEDADQLVGNYFLASTKQNFEVSFNRMK